MGGNDKFYILKRTWAEAQRLSQRIQKIKHPQRVTLIYFEDNFVDEITQILDRTNEIQFKIEDEYLDLQIQNHTYRTEIGRIKCNTS